MKKVKFIIQSASMECCMIFTRFDITGNQTRMSVVVDVSTQCEHNSSFSATYADEDEDMDTDHEEEELDYDENVDAVDLDWEPETDSSFSSDFEMKA